MNFKACQVGILFLIAQKTFALELTPQQQSTIKILNANLCTVSQSLYEYPTPSKVWTLKPSEAPKSIQIWPTGLISLNGVKRFDILMWKTPEGKFKFEMALRGYKLLDGFHTVARASSTVDKVKNVDLEIGNESIGSTFRLTCTDN